MNTLPFSSKDYHDKKFDTNPHLIPSKKSKKHIPYKFKMLKKREEYKRWWDRKFNIYTLHWGQRKLLLTLILFMIKYHKKAKLVVYAGSAPGTNIEYVARLFPNNEFHLYDPASFKIINMLPNIHIFNEYFTVETCKKYTHEKTLFVSDIRTAEHLDETGEKTEEFEEEVKQNMQMQLDWYLILKPQKAMFKFRIPYNEKKYRYLKGKLYIQPFAPMSTTEMRLITNSKKMVDYDCKEIEEKMYYFNMNIRSKVCYKHHAVGYDHCFDCTYEIKILRMYLKKIYKCDKKCIQKNIIKMHRDIDRLLALCTQQQTLFDRRIIKEEGRPEYTIDGFQDIRPIVRCKTINS